jgi:hypothetical protein
MKVIRNEEVEIDGCHGFSITSDDKVISRKPVWGVYGSTKAKIEDSRV